MSEQCVEKGFERHLDSLGRLVMTRMQADYRDVVVLWPTGLVNLYSERPGREKTMAALSLEDMEAVLEEARCFAKSRGCAD